MLHLTPDTNTPIDLHGVTFTPFARSSSGATSLAAWTADFAPHAEGQAHTMSEEEIFYVTAGELEVEVGPDCATVRAGEAVVVPSDTPFRVTNSVDAPARAWVTTTIGMTATMLDDGSHLAPPWAQ